MRKYAKVFITAALAAGLSTAAFAANNASQLTDIDNYWGKAAVQYFYDRHYVSGTDGKFRPNEDITREGIAAIINNMIGEDSAAVTTDFKDVKGRWSERAISSLVDKQIMSGYSNGTFRPTQNITREEFAVIAYNYMSYKGMATTGEQTVPFADEAKISPWAKEAVNAMGAAGYMTGSNNVFNPKEYVTRGEAVNVLYRIVMTADSAQAAAPEATPEEASLETKVFKDITEAYGSIKKFAGDGIMYWQGDTLRIGVKTQKNKDELESVLAADKTIPKNVVYVQTAKYSYDDYKKMMSKAEEVYRATEATDAVVKTDVDYLNEKVVLTVQTISEETRANLDDALGGALRIVVQ